MELLELGVGALVELGSCIEDFQMQKMQRDRQRWKRRVGSLEYFVR